MVVLGICGRERDAASALIVDRSLMAAMTEEACIRAPRAGYAGGGFPFASAAACLRRAGVSPRDVTRVVWCDMDGHAPARQPRPRWSTPPRRGDGFDLSHAASMRVGRLQAHASQLRATGHSEGPIAILETEGRGHAAVFEQNGRELSLVRTIDHFSRVAHEVKRANTALGVPDHSLSALEALASEGQPVYADALARGIWYVPSGGIERDARVLASVYADAEADAGGRLDDRAALHLHVRRTRAHLAASIVRLVARIASDVGADVADTYRVENIGLGGTLFSHHEVLEHVRASLVVRPFFAPLPTAVGLAFGAAVAGAGDAHVGLPYGLAVGPQFSESEVKQALDAAHLDYVYEPVWDRIVTRASRLLARGKLVGWFQGAMDFGTRSLGGRSILCDPSSRYARDNVNRYLQHRDDDLPPPLVMTTSAARDCLEQAACSPFGFASGTVRSEFRVSLQAGITAEGRCRFQTVPDESASRLPNLLQSHRKRTGVPALLHVNLCGADEPIACTPRDALRTTYSSPVDALFIERFVLMKDYWLLRSDADGD
jgi:carbamoyltransferase